MSTNTNQVTIPEPRWTSVNFTFKPGEYEGVERDFKGDRPFWVLSVEVTFYGDDEDAQVRAQGLPIKNSRRQGYHSICSIPEADQARFVVAAARKMATMGIQVQTTGRLKVRS